jgi:leucyl/phenylalanyl-tRNA--protein transferase
MAREPFRFHELFVPVDAEERPLAADIKLPASHFFPPPTSTTPDGLLCIGGHLTPPWLLDAYSHGIFPWPMWEDEPVAWWSPDPRAVIELDGLHISQRLQRTIRSGKFHVTRDQNFAGVILGCATAGGRTKNTWLTPAMMQAYNLMHTLGHAHSVEVWLSPPPASLRAAEEGRGEGASDSRGREKDNLTPTHFPKGRAKLVGGTYGLAIGGLFAAESMFHFERDASKVALAHLVSHLSARGYQLLDIQQLTPHTASMGAKEIPRDEYLRRLARAIAQPIKFAD